MIKKNFGRVLTALPDSFILNIVAEITATHAGVAQW